MDISEKIQAKLALVIRHPAYSDLAPAHRYKAPKQELELEEVSSLPKRMDSYIISQLGQATAGKVTNKSHRKTAEKLRQELERLIIALATHYHPEKEIMSQETALRLARGLLRLNERLHTGETLYTWQRYCLEQSLGEKLARRLLALKKSLSQKWLNNVRDAARNFAKAHEDYLKLSRKELGRLH